MKKIIFAVALAFSTLMLNLPAFAVPQNEILNTLKLKSFIIQYRYDPAPLTSPSTGFGHNLMKALNPTNDPNLPSVYQQSDIDKLKAEAFAYFRQTAGLDFVDTAVPFPGPGPFTGLPTVLDAGGAPLAIAIPLSVGIDNKYYVLHDSDTTAFYKNNGQWIVRNFSWIVQYLQSGTVPAGATAAGQSFVPTDIVSYGYTVHLKKDTDWTHDSGNREFFTVSTTAAQKQPVNGFGGAADQHVALQYINERSHAVGFGSDNVYNRQPSNTAGSRVVQHPIYFLADPPPAVTISPVPGYTTVGAVPLP